MVKLCECGCGEPAPIAKKTRQQRGQVEGQPIRFIHGHNTARPRLVLDPSMWVEDEATGCWIWQRVRTVDGYGRLAQRLAHRVTYDSFKGPIPDGFDIDHLCRVPPCVNPAHLEAVPRAINIRRGIVAKLTPEQVAEIRRLYGSGSYTQLELSGMFNTAGCNISGVCRYETWKDIEGFPAGI